MTKSDISYASVPTSAPSNNNEDLPYVEGFSIGSSHAVTVIVDENKNSRNVTADPYADESPSAFLRGTRRPVELSMCPNCQKPNVRTMTRTYPSTGTWVGVVATALCFFPLAWVPLVVDTCKQTDHYCQSCGKKIGTVKPLEGCFMKERY
jgi:LITAF-like zinc ribbon domain